MTVVYWLDVGAFVAAAIFAVALTVVVIGAQPKRRVSQLFAFYTLTAATTAVLATLLRLALWLGMGRPELMGRIATWTFTLMGPTLVLFSAHYVDAMKPRVRIAVGLGFVWTLLLLPFMLRGDIVTGHHLTALGTTTMMITPIGYVSSVVSIGYLAWSLVLFLQYRNGRSDLYLPFSTAVLLLGVVAGGLLEAPFPIISFGVLINVSILGYSVVSLQLFNPLRDRNLQLELEVAERRRAEAEIRRLQDLFQAVASSMPAALITLDLDGTVLTWNPAATRLTGFDAESVLGHCLWNVCPEMRTYQDLAVHAIEARRSVLLKVDEVLSDSGRVCLDVEAFPLQSENATGVVLRLSDVTRRVKLEELALQSSKMAGVGNLAAGVAHELNNPLGAVLQGIQMVERVVDSQVELSRVRMIEAGIDPFALQTYLNERRFPSYVRGIRDAAERAAKIVRELLGISRINALDLAPQDLNHVVQTAMTLALTNPELRRSYGFQGVDVVYDLAEYLPAVMCDATYIEQVVLNLVQNAVHAMVKRARTSEDHSYQPMLRLHTSAGERSVILVVEDNGVGVLPHERERLFEPFFTTKEVGEGTGLGLWMCWSIVVQYHSGHIWAEPAPYGGSRFVVELPVAAEGDRLGKNEV